VRRALSAAVVLSRTADVGLGAFFVAACVASAREWVASNAAGAPNPYTHEPIREEDSPGNHVVRDMSDRRSDRK